MGSAFGAKGDVAAISRRLTVAHARMVPVAQVSLPACVCSVCVCVASYQALSTLITLRMLLGR
jgi:hypothetical protein